MGIFAYATLFVTVPCSCLYCQGRTGEDLNMLSPKKISDRNFKTKFSGPRRIMWDFSKLEYFHILYETSPQSSYIAPHVRILC